MTTIAQKCRNPLNIRASVKNNWLGSRGSYKGFVVFNSTELGYRAALLLLRNYVRNGHRTIFDIINRWAPPTENDTDSYIKTVCSSLGCQPSDEIVGTAGLCMLCGAMAHVESGVAIPDTQYLYGICQKFNLYVEPTNSRVKYGKREKISLD